MERFGVYVVGAIMFAILALLLAYDPFSFRGTSEEYVTAESIPVGERAQWNAERTTSPVVLYDYDERIYKMWYVGIGVLDRSGIGYATSQNGVDWTLHSEPVLETQDGWEAGGFRSVHVVQDGKGFRMWYAAESLGTAYHRIGYATSSDGIRWSKSNANPVVLNGDSSAWDSAAVEQPFVLRVDDQWRMWFTGVDAEGTSRIGYATSTDGVRWSKAPVNPVFSGQRDWSVGGVGGVFVSTRYDGQLYEMWFHGKKKADGDYQLGRAYSNDGIAWAEDEEGPRVGADETSFLDPWVATINDYAFIWTEQQSGGDFPRQTIHFTSWPKQIVNDVQVVPTVVPVFINPS